MVFGSAVGGPVKFALVFEVDCCGVEVFDGLSTGIS